ncbi:MAG TPA: ABC transporter substrate-binding protein [Xanthobacteraceae bacterium]|nr:ABC transporter substrate-binding protein [Xanthobacteraceae bacterium]
MISVKKLVHAGALVVPLVLLAAPASAQDKLRVAIGQINNWENQVPTLGMQAGIFQKHKLELENFGTQGAGETLQPIISGSAQIGIGVGTSGAMRAFAKGAPVRALAAGFTGTNDIFWYVRGDSPIKSLKDLTEKNTIAYSTNGSTSNNIVLGFVKYLGVKAKPTPTGGPPATLTAVMSGQVDVGWGAAPLGVAEMMAGKIRVIARGSDLPQTRNQTVRVVIVNADALKANPEVMKRFMTAYREVWNWMYSSPDAIKMYAEKVRVSEAIAKQAVKDFYPKEAIDPDRVQDIDKVMADAVELKFLDAPLTKEQLAEFFQLQKK